MTVLVTVKETRTRYFSIFHTFNPHNLVRINKSTGLLNQFEQEF